MSIVVLDLNEEETKKLQIVTQCASQELVREYNIATICLNIIRNYLDTHVIEYGEKIND